MTALDVLAELQRLGVEVVAAGEKIRFRPGEAVGPELREAMRRHRPEILRLLRGHDGTAPRYAPGCLYDFVPGCQVRPTLRCVSHPGCPKVVTIWRKGILSEMFSAEKLVGKARQDGEREWLQKGG